MQTITTLPPIYILRYVGSYAVKCHLRGYSVVADREATRFDSIAEAEMAIARIHDRTGTKPAQFQIAPLGSGVL